MTSECSYRFDVEPEDFVHVGRDVGEEDIEPPVRRDADHHNRPDRTRLQHVAPRHLVLKINMTERVQNFWRRNEFVLLFNA